MSKDNKEVLKSNDVPKPAIDMNDIEMIFGTPNSPKGNVKPDVHLITNEKKHSDVHPLNNNNYNNNVSSNQNGENEAEMFKPTQPLLEPDRGRQKPPLAGPEVDDLEGDVVTGHTLPYPGIDDGLLEPGEKKPEGDEHDPEDDEKHGTEGSTHSTHDDGGETGDVPFNGIDTRIGLDDRPISPAPGSIPDVNTYQQKKNLAQGMMDLALLSANANQLRYVLESASTHPYYYPSLTFISLSIILQIAVGVGLIMNSRYDVKDHKDICKADKINNFTVLGVFLVTIVNVFITSFSVATPQVLTQQAG